MSRQGAEEKRSLEVAEASRETEWQKPSFVGEMFMGRLHTDLLFPFPEQDPEDRRQADELLEKLRRFLAEKVDADRIDREKEIPAEVFAGLRELGLFGIKIPKDYGGLGLSQINYNRIIQLVASHCASTAVMLSAHQSIGVPQPLKIFGTEEQKKKYLPRLAAGEISAFALTEPDVGSDPSSMTTTATPTEDGAAYLINGEKLWITNGPIADLLIVMARTNDPKAERPEITAFIVDGKAEGFSVEHRCDFMGLKGIQNGLLKFNNVRVGREDIVVGLGEGLRLALRTLNTGRLTLPAACGGTMKQALAMAVQWANERSQWGAPVGHHEAVAAKIARLAAEIYAVESLTWLTSAMADRSETDIRLEAAMAKLFCTEAMWRGLDEALQIRGGRGYETADSLKARGEAPMPMERLLRDARINLIIEGTSEIMHLFIAREALDPHLKVAGASATSKKVDVLGAGKFYARWYPPLWLPRFQTPGALQLPGGLGRHLRFLERATRRLARDLFHMIALHRQGLQRKQKVLGRLVDSGAELFAMAAVLSRAAAPGAQAGELELAELFCRQARRRLAHLHRAVYLNDDRFAYRCARQVLEGRFPILEENILSTWKGEADRS
ncbi:putative acyl-CoA dehydrogenase FadE10 [Desulfuromonas versatilis]|uniref:Acyl-CoA dehydrogenase FadE10 n=1 Tax=Desulfuromonas versatilis TaxID=2802975 RepID=A0ABM8I0Y9_9BACT|nr:acyl-CoA dehydrogenase family protein [Desulfuromonas versatilis]BCR06955.1 putative acyl-CoA dehydrogenase FadE10 [Desulfuromonas versatilis]